jgi:hypothetical protein
VCFGFYILFYFFACTFFFIFANGLCCFNFLCALFLFYKWFALLQLSFALLWFPLCCLTPLDCYVLALFGSHPLLDSCITLALALFNNLPSTNLTFNFSLQYSTLLLFNSSLHCLILLVWVVLPLFLLCRCELRLQASSFKS